MRSLLVSIVALALSVNSSADLAVSTRGMPDVTQMKRERVVIGSLADVSTRYDNAMTITVIHILEFSTDVFPGEPTLLQVRLCGDQHRSLELAVHTNITLIYELPSHSRLTACHNLTDSGPWHDGSKWQTVTFTPIHPRRNAQYEKVIRRIIHGDSVK